MYIGRKQRADGGGDAGTCGCGQNAAAVRCLLQPTQSGTVRVLLSLLGFIVAYSYYVGFYCIYIVLFDDGFNISKLQKSL